MQVSLTRDDLSIPWGFRLKGGAEYNVPLSILKVPTVHHASCNCQLSSSVVSEEGED